MRKLISALFLTVGVIAGARQISPTEALTIASDFMTKSAVQEITTGTRALKPMKASGDTANEISSPYYIFNRGENDGFVIISGDDRAPMILGYSDRGNFDLNNLPPQLKSMMEQWTEKISKLTGNSDRHASWARAASFRAQDEVLHETANWGQGAPFNDLCPTVEGEKAPAGCVATAMAIAMKYHNWPDCTRGGIESDCYFPEEKFDFDSYEINWETLSDIESSNFADQAAKLTYSAGVAAQMIYGPQESAAETWTLSHILQYFYSYDKECQFIPRNKFDDATWERMLRSQLEEVGPVVYNGFGSVGHCFVVDGYNSEGYYHVNWGWSGAANGYFSLDMTLDGGMSFSEYQGMVINIKPDKDKKSYSRAWISNGDEYFAGLMNSNDWNFLTPDIKPGVPVTFKVPSITIGGFCGYLTVGVVDQDDNIIDIADLLGVMILDGYRYFCAFPGSDPEMTLTLPELKDGQRYNLITQEVPNWTDEAPTMDMGYTPAYPASGNPSDWKLVLGGMVYPSHFYATGNRSDVVDMKFHVDEDLPALFINWNKASKEFTVPTLKGSCAADNIAGPFNKMTFVVECTDKDGNPEDAFIVAEPTDNYYFGFNVAAYSDNIDVYVKRRKDCSTRNDSDVLPELIVEHDGLVFKKKDNQLALIGYDGLGAQVTIPSSISVDGKELPVTSVEDEALVFAPVETLTIKGENIHSLGRCAFAGLNLIKSILIEGCLEYEKTGFWASPFLQTSPESVYLENVPSKNLLVDLHCINQNYYSTLICNKVDNYYISGLPDKDDYNPYIEPLYIFESWKSDTDADVINSYCIPGLGETNASEIANKVDCPLIQMWTYQVDSRKGLISIKDPIENVNIDKVIINGVEVAKNVKEYYEIPAPHNNGIEVVVEYTVNGIKKMTTRYSKEYNSCIETEGPLMGDADGNGIVDANDVVVMTNYYLGLTADIILEVSDINGDGVIDAQDALLTSNIYLNENIGKE